MTRSFVDVKSFEDLGFTISSGDSITQLLIWDWTCVKNFDLKNDMNLCRHQSHLIELLLTVNVGISRCYLSSAYYTNVKEIDDDSQLF